MLNFSLDYPEQKMYLGYGFGASLLWIFWPIFMEWIGSSTIIENGDFWVLFLLIIAFWGGILQSKIVAMFSEQSTILVTKNRLGWISIISLVILFAWSTITSFRGIMSETRIAGELPVTFDIASIWIGSMIGLFSFLLYEKVATKQWLQK